MQMLRPGPDLLDQRHQGVEARPQATLKQLKWANPRGMDVRVQVSLFQREPVYASLLTGDRAQLLGQACPQGRLWGVETATCPLLCQPLQGSGLVCLVPK